MRLASRFGYAANQIRRERPLTHEELMHHVPGIFGEDKHTSRSQNYTYIPTITVLGKPAAEGFSALFRLPDPCARTGPPGIHKTHAASAAGREINGEHVPEIILLNSHDGILQLPDAAGLLQVRLPERMRLWSVSGGSACSAPGKCGGQSH